MMVNARLVTAAAAAAALASIPLASIPLASPAAAATRSPQAYMAVIDAGSSGTRLTLYANRAGTLSPVEAFTAPTKSPGLSSFEATPQQAGPGSITPLLAQLDGYLAPAGIAVASVPVSLLATAGMRDVQHADPAAAQAILDSTAQAINASGHPLADNRILPGEQEASLAWLDANVIQGTLDRADGGLGTIEVGGASAQVAFRSPAAQGRGVSLVHVDGRDIPVVAVSYLGLGSNDARTLMQSATDAGSFCFPNNAPGSAPTVYLAKAARPVNASTASFSWSRCATAYDSVITSVGAVRTVAAQVPPAQLRTLPGFSGTRFLGLGSIPLIFTTLGAANAKDVRGAVRGGVMATCPGPDAWSRSAALYPPALASFSDTLCSTATYEYELAFGASGVGIRPSRFSVLDPSLPQQPAWTRGYAITVLDP